MWFAQIDAWKQLRYLLIQLQETKCKGNIKKGVPFYAVLPQYPTMSACTNIGIIWPILPKQHADNTSQGHWTESRYA